MLKREIIHKLVAAIAVLAVAQMACSVTTPTPTPRIGGIVQGVVYGDLNGNGAIDPGEGPLEGAQVTLADCGALQNQLTVADGKFNFANLPEGTCHVSVSKTDWIFSGSYPSLTYPVPVASNPDLPTSFSIFMAPVGGTPTFTITLPPTDTPTLAFTDTITEVPSDTPTVGPTDTSTPEVLPAMVTPKSLDANCRFGPGTTYLSVGGLKVGKTVPISGMNTDHSWWQIDNPNLPGTPCWVSNAVTIASGSLDSVPVVEAPSGQVITLKITTPSVVHGTCGGPNATSFSVSVTTNGPSTVTYHLEIYNGDGTARNKTDDATLTFASASTQTFDPGGAYKTDCGNFKIQVVVTSPNNKTAEASWSVVSP